MAEKIEVGVTIKGTEKVSSDLTKVNTKTSDISGSADMATGSLDKMTGGALSAFKGIIGGVKKAVIGMKTLRGAIMSTGIGLLVVAVGALAAAFTSSEEGQNKFAKIMAVIGSVTDNAIDLFADLGEVIIKAFENPQEAVKKLWEFIKTNFVNRVVGMVEFLPSVGKAIKQALSLDFAGAAKTATDAVAKMTIGVEDFTDKAAKAAEKGKEYLDQVAEEMKLSAEVADMRAKAAKLDRQLVVDRSTIEAEIASLRLKSRQEEEFGAEERKQALLDAQVLEEQLLEKEMEALKLRADAQTLENTFARSNIENLDKEAAAIAAYNNVQTKRLNSQKSTQRELNRLSKEIQAQVDAEAKAVEAAEKKKQDALDATYKAKQKANEQILKDAETAGEYLMSKRELEAQALMFEYQDLEEAQAKKVALLEESNTAYPGELELNKQILEDIETEYNRRSLALTKKFADEDQAIKDAASDKTIATAEATAQAVRAARLGIVAAGFDALKSMAKTEEGQKRLAISQILVNQGIAMSEAFKAAQVAAAATGPAAPVMSPLFTAQMIGMVLSSFASIKGVMNQAGASSGSIGTSSGGGSSAGMQLGLTPNIEGVTQVQEAMPPIKAFVVQSQLADESALAAQLKAMASL